MQGKWNRRLLVEYAAAAEILAGLYDRCKQAPNIPRIFAVMPLIVLA